MKKVEVEYIESGAFASSEEDCFLAGIEYNSDCVVLKKEDFESVTEALKESARLLEFLRPGDAFKALCHAQAQVNLDLLDDSTEEEEE